MKRIVHEFSEIDTQYAYSCHLIQNNTIYQVNYNGDKLFNALALFYAHPDQSNTMCRYSFRVIFIDYLVD